MGHWGTIPQQVNVCDSFMPPHNRVSALAIEDLEWKTIEKGGPAGEEGVRALILAEQQNIKIESNRPYGRRLRVAHMAHV